MSNKVNELALMAILTSLVVAATALHVPMPGFRIYFNLGEGVIYIIALTWGGRYGAMCGGLGASLADLLLGYPLWAPFTLAIKSAEGFIVGHFARKSRNIALLAGASIMITGYAAVAGLLYGPKAIPIEIATDAVQTGIGAVLAVTAMPILRKAVGRYSPPDKQQSR